MTACIVLILLYLLIDPSDLPTRHIQRYVPQAVPRTLLSFDAPVSPHLAAKYSKKVSGTISLIGRSTLTM